MIDFSVIFVAINTWLVIRICRSNKVHLLLKLMLCVSFFGWNAAPAILMYIPQMLGRDDFASDTYIMCSYYNEIYLFLAYSIGYYLINKKGNSRIISKPSYQDSKKVFDILIILSIIISLYKVFIVLKSTSSYFEGNNIYNITALGPIDFISGYALSFLFAAAFLFKDRVSSLKFKIIIVIVISYFMILTLRGGRIYIFGIVFLLLYYALKSHKKNSVRNLVFAGIVGVLGLFLLPVLGAVRGEDQVTFNDVVEASSTDAGKQVIGEVLTKTNSVMYGSYLIETDGIGKWNGKMYSSTLFALFPRFIFSSKPEPGSVDGTLEGLPSRASAIYSIVGTYSGIGNNGVPASISSLWGGGWIAYFIELLFTGCLIFIINCVFISNKPIFSCLVFYLISFPVGVLEVSLPTILISIQRFVIIYFTLYILFSFFNSKKSVNT